MVKKKVEIGERAVGVPLKWYIPDNIITRFASNMVIQTMESEFKISFFEIKPEILLPPSETLPKEVRAECVASVIVTADRLPKFIEVLQTQLNLYNSAKNTNK